MRWLAAQMVGNRHDGFALPLPAESNTLDGAHCCTVREAGVWLSRVAFPPERSWVPP
jgi:hypothetical protein